MKTLFQTPVVTVSRRDWTISVMDDDGFICILPQWRFPGGHWMMPAESTTPIPGSVLNILLGDAQVLITLARVVETEQAARMVTP
jgi:hypothetical protein